MKKIKTVGVVGAGTMGAAIAQKMAQQGFAVILNDREEQYLEKGINGIKETLQQGVDRNVFSENMMNRTINNISTATDQNELKKCDLIIEAIFEDFDAKCSLFKTLDKIVDSDVILATNTSSFSVTEMAESVSHPERFVGLHYFYHAAKNRLVEIIPGKDTSDETVKAVKVFSVMSGKDPILTKDRYGFAVNRFFVPWLNESVRLLGENVATIAQIDAIAMKTFGIGMGPFALMNATGVPIALHAEKTLEVFGPSYLVSKRLEEQVEAGEDWDLSGTEECTYSEEQEKVVSERLLGSVFFVCSQILAEEVCTPVDLNRGAKIGLRWRMGPVDMMIRNGVERVKELVSTYANLYGEKIPGGIETSNWEMEYVTLDIVDTVATITMSRPEDLNALNEDVMEQLNDVFQKAEADSAVDTIVLTGSGKAFVAGADIKFFVKNIKKNSIDNIISFTSRGHDILNRIDKCDKKVVAILNGLTLGGGMELALSADVILALPNVKIAFPETGIGIYPGLGGTQRTAIRVGKGLAKYLILTGDMIGAKDAKEIGLIDDVISYDDLIDITEGVKRVPLRQESELVDDWKGISCLYGGSTYKEILEGNYSCDSLPSDRLERLTKVMKYKAPVAMDIAEELIDKGRGTQSELERLRDIFTTDDALLGLSSIGKKVAYSGK